MTAKDRATTPPAAKFIENGSPIRSSNGPVPNAATPSPSWRMRSTRYHYGGQVRDFIAAQADAPGKNADQANPAIPNASIPSVRADAGGKLKAMSKRN
jgi:hypothetical protein